MSRHRPMSASPLSHSSVRRCSRPRHLPALKPLLVPPHLSPDSLRRSRMPPSPLNLASASCSPCQRDCSSNVLARTGAVERNTCFGLPKSEAKCVRPSEDRVLQKTSGHLLRATGMEATGGAEVNRHVSVDGTSAALSSRSASSSDDDDSLTCSLLDLCDRPGLNVPLPSMKQSRSFTSLASTVSDIGSSLPSCASPLPLQSTLRPARLQLAAADADHADVASDRSCSTNTELHSPHELQESGSKAIDARVREVAESSSGVTKLQISLSDAHAEGDAEMDWLERADEIIERLPTGAKIFDLYSWDTVLQEEGNGGKVVVCRPKEASPGALQTPNRVMKIKSKASLRKHHVENHYRKAQARMLEMPPHPGVVRVHRVLEDDAFYYVLMDKANGGSLLSSLLHDFPDGRMPASAVKLVMRDILEAVKHLHTNGVLHRDIKLDNLVMHAAGASSACVKRVMLVDFDHAYVEWSSSCEGWTNGVFGTRQFNAPETFHGHFSEQSELFSVGTILYLLMSGRFPFETSLFARGDGRKAIAQRMSEVPVDFAGEPWASQPTCKDLCQWLLAVQPHMRPSCVDDALQHRWFSDEHAL
eukprot:TRINITY_DN24440_c0_g1_i1.p1 TRINITY_DN24440_c0_g1~~TRINITY_DN24440_c0_g1_i1.p1  ORF type:complete len:589 (-),score=96.29 TRINITY_DN24440_c0_g1_i1:319-2085(-)